MRFPFPHTDRAGKAHGWLALSALLFWTLLLLLSSPRVSAQVPHDLESEQGEGVAQAEEEDYLSLVLPVGTHSRTVTRSYNHTEMSGWAAVETAGDHKLLLDDLPTPEYCTDKDSITGRIVVDLMSGVDDYRFGAHQINFQVSGTINGILSTGLVGPSWNFTLTLSEKQPHQRYITETYDLHQTSGSGNALDDVIRLEVRNVVINTPANVAGTLHGVAATAQTLFKNGLDLTVTYEEVVRKGAVRKSDPTSPIIAIDPIGMTATTVNHDSLSANPVTFTWSHLWSGMSGWDDSTTMTCATDEFASYQIQVLRLFNRDVAKYDGSNQHEWYITDTVDWSRALVLETGNPSQELAMTVAEGRGWYAWRVRPIGSLYEGGAANDRNWGAWSWAPAQGEAVELNGFGSGNVVFAGSVLHAQDHRRRAFFFYTGLSTDTNWIFSRTYSEGEEGTRFAEQMTYATPTLRSRQQQRHLQSTEQTVVTETLYDLSGRPVLQTMSAPVDLGTTSWPGFSYREDFISYGPDNYDIDTKLRTPDAVTTTSDGVNEYYSSANSDVSIPSAEGYPYSRTRYYPDASGRVSEQGGPGQVHRIGGADYSTSAKDHTVRTMYGPSSDEVLRSFFGREAPDAETVRAVYTIDPNKVTSIEYRNAAGKTIASFLAKAASNPYLDVDLGTSESSIDNKTLTFPFTNRLEIPDGLLYAQRLVVEVLGTEVTVQGKLTPDSVEACAMPGRVCTYRLRLEVYDADDLDLPIYSESKAYDPDGSWVLGQAVSFTTDPVATINGPRFSEIPDFDPGSYIVIVRLMGDEPDPGDPYGRRPSQIKAAELADSLRTKINRDAYTTMCALLDEGELDSLYRWINQSLPSGLTLTTVPHYDSITLVRDTTLRVSSDCWQLDVPVKRCPVFVCDDPIAFEQMLYDEWGDDWGTTPEKYFRRPLTNGSDEPLYPLGSAGGFGTNGKGAFDEMIEHMLDEPGSCWTCEELTKTWKMFVRTFGQRATKDGSGDPAEARKDYNLLDDFLSTVGRTLEGTSTSPYGSTGYLEYAYKYFDFDLIDEIDHEVCLDAFDYPNRHLWGADGCNESVDEKEWEGFYNCISRAGLKPGDEVEFPEGCFLPDGTVDTNCVKLLRDKNEEECRTQCELNRDAFSIELRHAYYRAGYRVAGDTLSPDGGEMPEPDGGIGGGLRVCT